MASILPISRGGAEDGFLIRRGNPIDETKGWETTFRCRRGVRPLANEILDDAIADCFNQHRTSF